MYIMLRTQRRSLVIVSPVDVSSGRAYFVTLGDGVPLEPLPS
jgi:hypothetical protein